MFHEILDIQLITPRIILRVVEHLLTRDSLGRRDGFRRYCTLKCAKEYGIICMTGIAGGEVRDLLLLNYSALNSIGTLILVDHR
jgi:hypothetical protein